MKIIGKSKGKKNNQAKLNDEEKGRKKTSHSDLVSQARKKALKSGGEPQEKGRNIVACASSTP